MRSLLNFYIYSSLHISIGAALFTLETYLIKGLDIDFDIVFFVFFATLFTYSIHKVIGISKVDTSGDGSRFSIINQYRTHIAFYIVLSIAAMFYYGMNLSMTRIKCFIPAGIISLLYVLPIFFGKRLRDFSYIKIFLIAAVWSYTAIVLPMNENIESSDIIMLIEKFCFVLAITIPFDIRDMSIDQGAKIETIPTILGVEKSYVLSCVLVLICFVLSAVLCFMGILTTAQLAVMTLIYLITFYIIKVSINELSDYYFSGLVDGTLVLRGILILTFTIFV